MATPEQLEEGIRRADAAGDTEAVKALGAELLRVRKAQTTFDGQTINFDVPDDATDAQIQQMSIDAIRKQNPNANLPAPAQVGVTQAPSVGEALGDLVTNIGAGAASALDFAAAPGRWLNQGLSSLGEWAFSGGGEQPNALSGAFDQSAQMQARQPGLADIMMSQNPSAANAPTATAAQFFGAALTPLPKMPRAPGPAIGLNAMAQAQRAAPAQNALASAASKDVGAREVVDAGKREGVRVLTSDVRPPRSFVGKAAQAFGERVPIAGTGGVRSAQQEERIAAVSNLLDEYGATEARDAVSDISADLLKTRGKQLETLTRAKNSVIEGLSGAVQTPLASKAIDEQVRRLRGINEEAYKPVIDKLISFERALESGKTLSQIEGNRKLLGDLFADPSLAAIKSDGQKALNAIYGPLREDMAAFIKQNGGPEAHRRWKTANDRLAAMAGELDASAFKGLLNKAETTPEAAARIIFGKTPSDINRLAANLSHAGLEKGRQAILFEAASRATDGGAISPQKFKTAMEKMAASTEAFFPPAEKARIDGFVRLLESTKRAGEAGVMTNSGQQAVPFAIGAAGYAMPIQVATAAVATRIYESAPVRDLLLRLGRSQPGSKGEAKIMERLSPMIAKIIPAAANDAGPMPMSPGAAAAQGNEPQN